ncbi:MAG TPA: hypothetical protein VHY20_11375, partial [Pirellulales bacterium]|nr:hypothetical protein [Pirellulales bacterium]
MNRDPGHTTADDEDRAQEFLRAKLCGAAFSDDELAACCERVSGVPRALASPRLLVPDRKLTREEYRVFGFCLIALSGQL